MNTTDNHKTPKDACKALGISRTTLQRHKKNGLIKGIKIGGKLRFSNDEINRVLTEGTQKPKA